jgi:hypothetical protein
MTMSRKEDYEDLLGKLSVIVEIPDVQMVTLKMADTVLERDIPISFPGYEDGVLVFDISRPIWGRDPEEIEKVPVPDPAPPKEITIPVHNPTEKAAAAYGVVAGVSFLGSSWPEVREEVKSGWQIFCPDRSITWEAARPQVRDAWNAVGSLLDNTYRKADS